MHPRNKCSPQHYLLWPYIDLITTGMIAITITQIRIGMIIALDPDPSPSAIIYTKPALRIPYQ